MPVPSSRRSFGCSWNHSSRLHECSNPKILANWCVPSVSSPDLAAVAEMAVFPSHWNARPADTCCRYRNWMRALRTGNSGGGGCDWLNRCVHHWRQRGSCSWKGFLHPDWSLFFAKIHKIISLWRKWWSIWFIWRQKLWKMNVFDNFHKQTSWLKEKSRQDLQFMWGNTAEF